MYRKCVFMPEVRNGTERTVEKHIDTQLLFMVFPTRKENEI